MDDLHLTLGPDAADVESSKGVLRIGIDPHGAFRGVKRLAPQCLTNLDRVVGAR